MLAIIAVHLRELGLHHVLGILGVALHAPPERRRVEEPHQLQRVLVALAFRTPVTVVRKRVPVERRNLV